MHQRVHTGRVVRGGRAPGQALCLGGEVSCNGHGAVDTPTHALWRGNSLLPVSSTAPIFPHVTIGTVVAGRRTLLSGTPTCHDGTQQRHDSPCAVGVVHPECVAVVPVRGGRGMSRGRVVPRDAARGGASDHADDVSSAVAVVGTHNLEVKPVLHNGHVGDGARPSRRQRLVAQPSQQCCPIGCRGCGCLFADTGGYGWRTMLKGTSCTEDHEQNTPFSKAQHPYEADQQSYVAFLEAKRTWQ